ncbi:bifunctional tetrahydrofolate synthase/dihydrofolate synthase [Buchnera aphidicola (Macrosiphoniella sanborni)]|uniref:Dihydrofolate synthase/folylpolyglutamate synthase n=1 Tax=Buchnera aphidicola (Macrosiphoniella sanborni) TaxID=1241865 RepID=A0A4D6Y2A8_9GAMM|nr:bifunctional tetrahydrofolate synthase/dihydrofolate synthase [Buchnera aphidicola]QCI23722.1 bifunctional tetrahydrofolate synthase/dihydrofolate synthase [Buchnera aphidicola (Macrosiphoniella sanborni)]
MINQNCSLSMWLKKLEKIGEKKTSDLILLKSIAKKLDLLDCKAFIFTVTGTNGKGTTCAMLERLLLKEGYQVGLYTSPHLFNYRERVRINGLLLDETEHITAFKSIELARKSFILTYFEFITLAALHLFRNYSLDIIILEVGLGGRLDATNIIDSDISIITNIAIDHSNVLGKTRESIAREKSGIFRKDTISVIGEINIPDIIKKNAIKTHTILKKINVDWHWKKKNDYWNFFHSNIELYKLPLTQIPLSNAAIALAALYYSGFKIHEDIVRRCISSVKLPGRFQIISTTPYIILDVAHNPHAASYLSNKLEEMNIKGKIYAVIGILKDKDIIGIINELKNNVHYWFTAPLQNIRTANKKQLKNTFPIHNTSIFNNINEAYNHAFSMVKKEDIILVFGSFLTISELFFDKIYE